ncbi:hypothetical protein IFM89_010624 [Coptis chinensis]|uniref:Uncharacterized protein n=1 Tax=Coptis chinensis TaxID=261450 RepID=A0A835IQW6_9MAGN|nr:hypothetical protein IFM89_010624 [Coptis chinensis]
MAISFLGSDMCGTVLKISDSNTASLSKIKGGEQCASPNNSQKNPDLDYTPHWITSLVGDEMNQQKQEVGKDATTTLERTGGQSEEMVSGTSVEDPKHKASCEEITDVTQTAKESEILVKKTCNFIEDVQTSPVLLEETSHTRMDIRISPDSLLTSQSNMDITLTEASMKRQEVQHSFCLAKFSESFKSHSNIADHCNKSVADEISDRLTVLLESVSEINKKRRMVEMEKKNRGSVIAALQKRLRELEEEILETEREFNRVVAAPWRTEIGFI